MPQGDPKPRPKRKSSRRPSPKPAEGPEPLGGPGNLIRRHIPFDSPREETFLNLLRTSSLLQQSLGRALKPWKLTPTQYNVLRILQGVHPDFLPCQRVGAQMVTPQPDVTRLLDRLDGRGLVTRSRDMPDRRVVRVGITPGGLKLLAELDEPVHQWLESSLGCFDIGELEAVVQFLERARAGC